MSAQYSRSLQFMPLSNITQFSPMFYLTSFPGLEAIKHWIFIPFFFMYMVAISGNCFILIIIKTSPRLHTPMYYLLSLLALTDLGLCVSTLPTTMGIFWFNSHHIYFGACQIQMFCIHSFSFMESSVLLIMSFDRFVAICHPLRYSVIITGQQVVRAGLIVIFRGPVATIPIVLLLKAFPYCGSVVLSHSFCLHQEVIQLACTDTTFNNLYGLMVVVFTVMLDLVLIALSYGLILHTVAGLASQEDQHRAFQTCTAHLCAVLVFFVPMMGLSLVYRFGKHAPPAFHLLMANVYLFVPPMLNPIIYSIKTKEIRHVIIKFLGLKKASSESWG
ncbi:olfactory receptor 51M1 [Macaca fascicularis]|uniref:Olfactory receptor n=2 Tax=Macaca TaxID=9539 RepID=A0A5F7Z9J5_MACMU|nr:olfactory receptor 51M1 [Macaca mulatta]XP_005578958.1 PREDICTED: olfactory receptor 51M1 [Macaca fascicularis]EHH61798.1 Olfactory receptor OR11-40 [Macaca fascicularis]